MDYLAENIGHVAIMRVTENAVAFKGITPELIGNVGIAEVGKAKIVVVYNEVTEIDAKQKDAIKNAWVLVTQSKCIEELVKIARPYITIVNGIAIADERFIEVLTKQSKGWNVCDAQTETIKRHTCFIIGKDGSVIEVLFGESRENPVGILSIQCHKD